MLDVAGIEVNWLGNDGKFNPDSDSVMNLRRTMSAKKPYLLLQNTDYDKFSHDYVEKYLLRSLFYGIYPSMFSANAADHPYWENPKWYNRDRDLFKKYLPILKKLSLAGWEPITYARSSRPEISIERFGANSFTVMNTSESALETNIVVDEQKLGLSTVGAATKNMLTGESLKSEVQSGKLHVKLKLKAGETAALELLRWVE